ncbi:bestrophin-like domain [Catellatospora tritici]|uniref:bestrophin-like domain n=1 Tax=Catellatospora tritici TaxID=2851566 RepID=UPI001C2D6642|nr:hypothetical protein [Catellatospora tritici]MBV1856527.1 hypothetical protein [Catellatospora tritici]
MLLFGAPTWLLALLLVVAMVGAAMVGLAIGTRLRDSQDEVRESFGVLQAALIAFVGLILAFGLSLAVGRYESRRQAVVVEANAIGTTYLRAQTLDEPIRRQSLALLVDYTDAELRLSLVRPGSKAAAAAIAEASALQRPLWRLAAQAVREQPTATAPRLYEETLNDMFDAQTVRVTGLANRVPSEVLLVEIIGAAIALALLGLHVGVLGRGIVPLLLAAIMVSLLLFTIVDLDRPTRGFIEIPDTALVSLRVSMNLPPAAP